MDLRRSGIVVACHPVILACPQRDGQWHPKQLDKGSDVTRLVPMKAPALDQDSFDCAGRLSG